MQQDVNDELPTFRSSRYIGEISENAQKGTPVTLQLRYVHIKEQFMKRTNTLGYKYYRQNNISDICITFTTFYLILLSIDIRMMAL